MRTLRQVCSSLYKFLSAFLDSMRRGKQCVQVVEEESQREAVLHVGSPLALLQRGIETEGLPKMLVFDKTRHSTMFRGTRERS